MRVALLNPTYWPEVRRGTERIVHDLGAALAARGHEVTLLTTHRGQRGRASEDGISVDRAWRPPAIPPLRHYEHYIETLPAALVRLARGGFDVAHAFFPTDAYAAALARRRGGPPFVFAIHGIPTRQYLVARRYRLEMLQRVVAEAGELTALSGAAAAPVRRYLLREPTIVPGGVDVASFAVDADRASDPTLICAASLADPRKRGPLLIEGFARLRAELPDARLLLAGGADMPEYGPDALELPDGVARLDADRTDVLARAYAEAWASVLPSVEEAFGLVMVESLAAGTPVAAARSGAAPEILTDPAHGRTFEPDDPADLARAMAEALELGRNGASREACRARAMDYDWSRVAAMVEGIYERVAA
jgi:phosphatidylinositol alpha-mannosyltransferase